MSLTEAELLNAAKNRAWEVIRQWRNKPMCEDETLAAMVTKAVLGQGNSVSEIVRSTLVDVPEGEPSLGLEEK
jgi:hypothetical protein